MTDGHRENRRRALARTACHQLTRLIADFDPQEGELTVRLSGKAASAVADLWPHLLRAHEWLEERTEDEEAARISVTLSLGREALESRTRNSLDTHLRWLQTGLAAAIQSGDHSNAFKITGSIAETFNTRGDYTLAVEHFERALQYSQGDRLTLAQDFDGLAYALARLGWAKESRALFTEALRLFRNLGHSQGELVTLTHFAEANVLWGDGQAALACLRPSVPGAGYTSESKRVVLEAFCLQGQIRQAMHLAALFEEGAAPQTAQVRAEALLLRARVWREGGDAAAAAQALRTARSLAEHGGDPLLLQDVLALLGRVESSLGNHKRAMRLLHLRLQQAAQFGARRRWESLYDLGEAAAAANDSEAAIEYHQQALDLAEGDVRFVTAHGPTRLAVQFQSPESFADDPEAVAAMAYPISDRRSVSQSLAALADLAARRGEDDAWDVFEKARRAASEDSFQSERVLDRAGQAAYDMGDYERAFSYQERRAASLRDRGLMHALAHAVGECADACLSLERNEQAMALYEEVARLDREIGDHYDEVHATANIGECLGRLGEMEQALERMRYACDLAAGCGYRKGRLQVLGATLQMLVLDDPYEALLARALAEALAAELGEQELGERLRAAIPMDLPDRALAEALAGQPGEQELGERLRTLLPTGSSEEGSARAAELGGRCNSEALAMVGAGETVAARRKLREALRWTALCPGEHRQMCTILMNRGDVALHSDDDFTAAASFMDAEAQATLLGNPSLLDDSQCELANVLGTRLGDPKAAVEVLLRLYERYSADEQPPPVRALTSLVHFEMQLSGWVDKDTVKEHLCEALDICRSQGDYAAEVDLLSLWSDWLERNDQYAEAVDAHHRAFFLAQRYAPERVDTVRAALDRLRAHCAQHDQQD
ncbi:hypothetical protein [Streptomyces chryseus]